MTAARVLLVEDNEDNREVLAVTLGESYEVFSYACAHEALTVLEAIKPDVVLLDIAMTPIDGLQCLEAIRATAGFESIPAIALTAYAHADERKTFLAAGFQAVVTKPILDHRELFATISALLPSMSPPSQNGSGSAAPSPNGSSRVLTGLTRESKLPSCGSGDPITPCPA